MGNISFSKTTIPVILEPIAIQDSVSIINGWYYGTLFYHIELEFKPNGTFTYFFQGCLGKSQSRGTWKKNGHIYTLTSFKKYKDDLPRFIYTPLPNQKDSLDSLKNSTGIQDSQDSILYQKVSISPIRMSFIRPETTNVYFYKKRYLLANDTLIDLTKSGRKSDIKFIQIKNSR